MSIYNQLKEKFIMKNAYEDWADYRKALTDIVIDNNYDSSNQIQHHIFFH